MDGNDLCFNESLITNRTCLPGVVQLELENCCCTVALCNTKKFKSFEQAFEEGLPDFIGLLFLLIIFCFAFGIVCKGIRYNWQNIPFFVVELTHEDSEYVQWVDPWRDTTTKKSEEKGFFHTRIALEIYVQKKHNKTASDLQQYWDTHPSTVGGIRIPAWSERYFTWSVGIVIAGVLFVIVIPIIIALHLRFKVSGLFNESKIFCDDTLNTTIPSEIFSLFVSCVSLYYAYQVWKHNYWVVDSRCISFFLIAMGFAYSIFVENFQSTSPITEHLKIQRTSTLCLLVEVVLTIIRVYLNSEQVSMLLNVIKCGVVANATVSVAVFVSVLRISIDQIFQYLS